jgi:WhiB family redox-sensing transcriptional regulator
MSWESSAACHARTMSLFFGPDREPHDARGRREQAAKSICTDCQVRGSCLDYALVADVRNGIWGGMNRSERKLERRRRTQRGRLAPAGTGASTTPIKQARRRVPDLRVPGGCDDHSAA